MATLTVVQAAQAGAAFAPAAAAGGGDEFANTGKEVAIIENGSGSSITVTAVSQISVDGLALADQTVAIAAGATKAIGPFDPAVFNDDDGMLQLTYSGVTTLTVGILRVNPA